MKKKLHVIILCMSLIFLIGAYSGCGSASEGDLQDEDVAVGASVGDEDALEETDNEVKEPEAIIVEDNVTAGAEKTVEEETSEVKVIESDWEVRSEERPGFPLYFEAYYTKDFGLAVGQFGEIHYTTDAGKEWPAAENKSNCSYGLEFVNDQVIYVVCNNSQVVKSTDGGRTFTRLKDFGGSAPNQCRYLSFIDENTGIIASGKKLGLTTDGGKEWKELTVPCEIIGMDMVSLDEMYLVGNDLSMYATKDGGATWEATPLNLPEGQDYLNLMHAVAFRVEEDGIKLFAFQKSTKLVKHYETKEFGAEWIEHALPEVKNSKLYLNNQCDVLSALSDSGMQVLYKK